MKQRCDVDKVVFEDRREILAGQVEKYLHQQIHYFNVLDKCCFVVLVELYLLVGTLVKD